MKIAVYPGSFDPITLGHLNLIKRASKVFDKLIVCVMVNSGKNPVFTQQERVELIRRVTKELPNVEAERYSGLLSDYAAQKGARYLVKGVRNGTDFDVEFSMALINKGIDRDLETVLLPASGELAHFSSTMAREMIKYHQDLDKYLPAAAADFIRRKEWD